MQKINLKKTTKEQMLNMLETAWQANAGANEEIAVLSKRIEEQNDALAKCVAEKNELRETQRVMQNTGMGGLTTPSTLQRYSAKE